MCIANAAKKNHRHQTLKKTRVLNILHGRPHGHPGIINQDINPGKFGNSVLNHGRTSLWTRHIGGNHQYGLTQAFTGEGDLLQACLISRDQDQFGRVRSQCTG
jgi:hypothetical protein